MNDLNGTITIPTFDVYTPVWNRRYASRRAGEVTQWNITSTCRWFGCGDKYDDFLEYDRGSGKIDKSRFPSNQGETYDANPGIRIIIEFKE